MSKRPPALKPGDVVGIAATARKVSAEELAPAISAVESRGLQVKLAPQLFEAAHQFAGDDTTRALSFQALLDDDSVKAILIARGGYGTVRIIDRLNFSKFVQSPKWITGYSDITVLHSHIHRHFDIQTLHSPMCISFFGPDREDQPSTDALFDALMTTDAIRIEAGAQALNREGSATGVLVGGNLSVLYSLMGSASDMDTAGKILFLEDLDEYLYHIDRMLVNLDRSGKLANLAGLVVGGMSEMKDNAVPFGQSAVEIIRSHVQQYSFPVAFGFPCGHEKRNLSMRFGASAQLSVAKDRAVLEIA